MSRVNSLDSVSLLESKSRVGASQRYQLPITNFQEGQISLKRILKPAISQLCPRVLHDFPYWPR